MTGLFTEASNRKPRFLLLYGSQTGQAKAIAEEVVDQAESEGFLADLYCLSATDKKFTLEKETCVIVVVSTTGDGEPPDTATKFWRRLKKTTNPATLLSGLNYALLALGDSNYTNFCNFGKMLDKRLLQLGASHLMDTSHADDAVGLEVVVEPWISSLWPVLRTYLRVDSSRENGLITTSDTLLKGTKMATSSESAVLISETSGDCKFPIRNSAVDGSDHHPKHTPSDDVVDANIASSANTTTEHTVRTANPSSDVNLSPLPETLLEGGRSKTDASGDSNKLTLKSDVNLVPSLCTSVPPLSQCTLSLPPAPPEFLQAKYCSHGILDLDTLPVQNGTPFPSCVSSIVKVPVTVATKLTADDAVKTVLQLTLDISDTGFSYLPGDAFGIVVKNSESEVSALINRLNLTEVADTQMEISLIENRTKKNASVPSYLPVASTLRHVLTTCCDIRSVPKKACLRTLVEYTTDSLEKRRLQELCSRQGSDDYSQFVRNSNLSLLDTLLAFSSCNPPMERILEHLPRLQARPYSVACSPLVDDRTIKIVFTLVKMSRVDGAIREGVATGWLNKITSLTQQQGRTKPLLEDTFSNMNLMESEQIPIFKRSSTKFCMPDDPKVPLILIGPGTGVAPFIGFLQHREMQRTVNSEGDFGEIWLFFGCRNEDKDYIYREYLQHSVESCVLSKLSVTFSRQSSTNNTTDRRYVQHAILEHAEEVVKMISEQQAMVFVCGDAKNMSKDVHQAIVSCFVSVQGISEEEGIRTVKKMQDDGLYLQDVWA